MANEQPLGPFQEVHKKIQEARDRARKEQEKDEALRAERLEKEAEARASTASKEDLSRNLIADDCPTGLARNPIHPAELNTSP